MDFNSFKSKFEAIAGVVVALVVVIIAFSPAKKTVAAMNRKVADWLDPKPTEDTKCVPQVVDRQVSAPCPVDTRFHSHKPEEFYTSWTMPDWGVVNDCKARYMSDKSWRVKMTYYTEDIFVSGDENECVCQIQKASK